MLGQVASNNLPTNAVVYKNTVLPTQSTERKRFRTTSLLTQNYLLFFLFFISIILQFLFSIALLFYYFTFVMHYFYKCYECVVFVFTIIHKVLKFIKLITRKKLSFI